MNVLITAPQCHPISCFKTAAITWTSTLFLASISCLSRCSACCSRCLMQSSSVACDADTAGAVGGGTAAAAANTGWMLTSRCLFATWASRNVWLMNAFGQCEHYNAKKWHCQIILNYHKTSNKRPWRLLEHGLRSPQRLLEAGICSRPGIYYNTSLKLPVLAHVMIPHIT